MVPANTHAERQPAQKATLYCPNCAHESRITGDWIVEVHSTSHSLDYECPECGYTIDSRPNERGVLSPTKG